MNKKVLILGANGLIGNNLTKYLIKKKIRLYPVVRSKKKEFLSNIKFYHCNNLNSKKSLFKVIKIIKNIKPDFLINCLGTTKHRKIKNRQILNFYLPKLILENKKKLNFNFIHITTDCVFDGKKGGYKENFIPNAQDDYGKSKAAADKILNQNNNVIILRTSTIGHEAYSKYGLLEWFLSQKKLIHGYKNAYFSGPTTLEFCKIIYKFVIKKQLIRKGLYHIAGPRINKYKLLELIKKVYDKNILIKPDYKLKIDRSLNSNKFVNVSKYKKLSWIKMLKEYKKFYDEQDI